ncbi:protein of unknown function [Moritella yayanosii]|uniref:Uncharacterized protein n=1 Tax=Moritella yayanosii TaxID=69539 RepID=A0A330LRB8_9GAMM|nr:protein of unknown function [Moritella yayanosii]
MVLMVSYYKYPLSSNQPGNIIKFYIAVYLIGSFLLLNRKITTSIFFIDSNEYLQTASLPWLFINITCDAMGIYRRIFLN